MKSVYVINRFNPAAQKKMGAIRAGEAKKNGLLIAQLPRDEAGCPSGLEIEPTSDPIYVQNFASEIEPGNNSTLHAFKIHFCQIDSSTGDEFLLKRGFPFDFKSVI